MAKRQLEQHERHTMLQLVSERLGLGQEELTAQGATI